ncbi:Argonaute siRNA chaperone complex subunit Arb1-domain-containing protein [Xylariaceae sp. FL0016]|nr:Argonaute siRNA chaperone complex subunit Arb1-domain-containing protein [Xylariaceae sp. FL0016]
MAEEAEHKPASGPSNTPEVDIDELDKTANGKDSPCTADQLLGKMGETHLSQGNPVEFSGEQPEVVESQEAKIDDGLRMEVEAKKKKKKKKKRGPKSRKHISGFEEFYADAPMTPAEADTEKNELYNSSRTFEDRIEECLQRYRAKRRMDNELTQMFNKYLQLGGIDASQRQFTGVGLNKTELEEADKDQIRQMTAVDFVGGAGSRFYEGPSDDWEVDFEAVAKGFLSRAILDWCLYDVKAIQKAADMIKNFLNYVLHHNVCEEYTDNIMKARAICDIAPAELRYMHELIISMPGTFNNAACLLFVDDQVHNLEDKDNLDAWLTFRLTLFLWGTDKDICHRIMDSKYLPHSIQIVETKKQTYRVVEIERPKDRIIHKIEEHLEKANQPGRVKPAGILKLVPSVIEHGYGNMPNLQDVDIENPADVEEYVVEDELLAKFGVGTKLQLAVCNTNIGVRFIKEVYDIRASFDLLLPQYLMKSWKDPAVNERPAPSIHDPNAEGQTAGAGVESND